MIKNGQGVETNQVFRMKLKQVPKLGTEFKLSCCCLQWTSTWQSWVLYHQVFHTSHAFFVGLSCSSRLCLLSSNSSNYPLSGWKRSAICLLYFRLCPLIFFCFWQMWKYSRLEQPLTEVGVDSAYTVGFQLLSLCDITWNYIMT